MADRFKGEISIPKQFLTPEVYSLISEEWMTEEDGEEFNGIVTFTDYTAINGEFENLEKKLIKEGIPFDRSLEGFCECTPEERYYRPDGTDVTVILSYSGDSYVMVDSLRKLLSITPDEAYLELAKLIVEADPQVKPLEDYTAGECQEDRIVFS